MRIGATPNRPRRIANPVLSAMIPAVAIVTGVIAFSQLLKAPPVACVNDASRWNTVWSLVHEGTYVIADELDGEFWWTIDDVKINGRWYSSKPPLYPTVIAGAYWVIHHVSGLDMHEKPEIVIRILLVLFNILPLIAFIWVYGLYLERNVPDPWARGFWLIAGAFGTYITGYSVTLNNHLPAAFGVMFAVYLTTRIVYDGVRCPIYYLLAGLSAGWAAANEIPAILFLIGVLAILGLRAGWRTWAYALPAAAVVVVAYMVTTWYATDGSLIPNYLVKDSPRYNYEGSYWLTPTGIDAAAEPKLVYIYHMLLGHHGILSLTPLWLFAAISMLLFVSGFSRDRAEIQWLTVALSVTVFAAYVVMTNNYGGGAKGLRWTFWLIPLWLAVAPLGAEHYSRSRWARAIALVALVISLWTVLDALQSPWGMSWLHGIYHKQGFVPY
ncbi:MAG: hypothetical protein GX134_01040 [candidate division WS1 bacterium]|jgi:hypothetical protein|nr:hypothetical protein [candidate division WS1 bacterium]